MKQAACLSIMAAFLVAAAPLPDDWQQRALAEAGPVIDQANDDWNRAIVSGDAEALSAPYAESSVFIGPDGATVRGKAAVRSMYANRRATVKILKAAIKSEGRVAPDPTDVYEWGSAEMTVQSDGKVKQASGRYLTVWHFDGRQWLITRNIAF